MPAKRHLCIITVHIYCLVDPLISGQKIPVVLLFFLKLPADLYHYTVKAISIMLHIGGCRPPLKIGC